MSASPGFDPRAKLALAVSMVVAALVTGTVPRLAILLGGFVAFVLVTRGIGIGAWLRSLKPIFYLVPFLLVLNTVFYASGTVWWRTPLGPVALSITEGGFQTALLIAVRLVLIAGVAAWFAGTTDVERFELALVRLGVPWSFAFLLSLTLRLVPEMRRRFRTIETAQRARGLEITGGPVSRIRARIPMLLPFFVAVIRYGYELSEALTARGFDDINERTSLYSIGHRPVDYTLYALSIVILGLTVL